MPNPTSIVPLRISLPRLFALLLCLFMARTARALDAEKTIDAAVAQGAAQFMKDPHAIGLSIGVIRSGGAHRYYFGTVSRGHAGMPDDQTLYPIASLTKTFTGTLLAQAALDNKLKLDDDIRQYLGSGYDNLVFDKQPVRVFHLVNHRSGLPFVLPDKPEASPDFKSDVPYPQRIDAIVASASRDDFFAGLRQVKLMAAPGSQFHYSNAAAQLAGYILEGIYGSPFEALVQQHIAAPLGMRDTVIGPTPQQKNRLAIGYDETGTPQPYGPDRFQAAGALKSTLPDMLAYAQWQMAETDPAVRLSHQSTFVSDDYAVGLNWQILTHGKRRVIFQDGAVPGFASLLDIQPESGMAIVILSNELDSGSLNRLRTLANGISKALDPDGLAVP